MLYKVLKKIHFYMYRNYTLNRIIFQDSKSKKSLKLGSNVKIYNDEVKIGKNVTLYDNVIIWGDGPVVIEDGCKIGFNTIIYSSKGAGVFIGKNCAIAANTYIIDMNHSTEVLKDNLKNENNISEKIVIGDNVWIAAQCVLAKGTKLSDNIIVGANSFVNKSFCDNSIIAGCPAKVIKYRGE